MEGKARIKVLWLIFLNRRGQSRRNSGFRGSSDELIKYVFPIENDNFGNSIILPLSFLGGALLFRCSFVEGSNSLIIQVSSFVIFCN
ncbi:unnamed protein product [Citrullus colocynthis]|uniref:Uncharacterized protein n=1 Tax=Citrullus colocynthis TaxID=252529 RepID=A0ABP0Y1S3_9ROSI